jgi:hypothetical protein
MPIHGRFTRDPSRVRSGSRYRADSGGFLASHSRRFHAGGLDSFQVVDTSPPVTGDHKEPTMADQKNVKIVLTPEQKAQLEKSTGKTVESIDLSVEELEQRIAPKTLY